MERKGKPLLAGLAVYILVGYYYGALYIPCLRRYYGYICRKGGAGAEGAAEVALFKLEAIPLHLDDTVINAGAAHVVHLDRHAGAGIKVGYLVVYRGFVALEPDLLQYGHGYSFVGGMGRVGAGGFIAEIHIEGICLCRRVGRGLEGYLLAAALTLANFGYIQRIAAAAGGNYGSRFARVLYVYLHVLQVGAVRCILYGELQIEGLARVNLVRAELVAFDYKLRHRGGGILVAGGRQTLADVYEKAHRAALEVALVIAVGDVEVHLLYAYGSLLAQTQMIQELHHLPPAYGAGV